MLGYFGDSIIHHTLTWITESLTCVCGLFACVYTWGTSVHSLIQGCQYLHSHIHATRNQVTPSGTAKSGGLCRLSMSRTECDLGGASDQVQGHHNSSDVIVGRFFTVHHFPTRILRLIASPGVKNQLLSSITIPATVDQVGLL